MTTHVIKRWTREHTGTGNQEDWRSHYVSFDGKNADTEATNTMQALCYGFIADSMKEGMTISIDLDEPHIIKITATKGEVIESVTYIRTKRPNDYPNYSWTSEHNEV